MRFIVGFIFFGLLFYAIYFYFPEAFNTLVSGAASLFSFLRALVLKIIGEAKQFTDSQSDSALFLLGCAIRFKR